MGTKQISWIKKVFGRGSKSDILTTVDKRSITMATIAAVAPAHSVSLSWTASTDTVDGYQVYRSTTSGAESTSTTPINTALITGTTYTDTTVSIGTQYFYEVRAQVTVNGIVTQSVVSNEVESVVIVPFPPTNLIITASN